MTSVKQCTKFSVVSLPTLDCLHPPKRQHFGHLLTHTYTHTPTHSQTHTHTLTHNQRERKRERERCEKELMKLKGINDCETLFVQCMQYPNIKYVCFINL